MFPLLFLSLIPNCQYVLYADAAEVTALVII